MSYTLLITFSTSSAEIGKNRLNVSPFLSIISSNIVLGLTQIIAITSPEVTDADEYIIKALVRKGIDVVHFRKPDSCITECMNLLLKLTEAERNRIVIHNYPELYHEFSLMGIHENKYVTCLLEGYSGLKTRSCHSFEEVEKYKDDYDYLFLSPIFNSISKPGYMSGYKDEEL